MLRRKKAIVDHPFEIVPIFEAGDAKTPRWAEVEVEIGREFDAGNLALLLGSGISHFAPSFAPVAGLIADRLRKEILRLLPDEARDTIDYLTWAKDDLTGTTYRMPFEALMARLNELNPGIAQDIAKMLTDFDEPNGIHRQVGDLLYRAALQAVPLSVITTNYDLGISLGAAFAFASSSGLREPHRVIAARDIEGGDHALEIFHVHGSLVDPRSMVLDYNDEFRLDAWKKEHLRTLLLGKTLLVMGFSGWDFDVSEALIPCGIRRLIWCHRTERSCPLTEWSRAAQAVTSTTSTTAVDTQRRIDAVLESLTMPVSLREDDAAIERLRYGPILEKYAEPTKPWLQVWARWAAIRAGYGNLARDIPAPERNLLTMAQQLDMAAFGHYYSGRHATGADLERHAAVASISSDPTDLYRYVYHRNNEAEFYNRGAFPWRSAVTIAQTIRYALRHRDQPSPDSPQLLRHEVRNLLTSAPLIWPLPAIFILTKPLQVLFRPILRLFGRLVRGGDVDKFSLLALGASRPGSPTFAGGEARFIWFGQRARLINIYRIGALRSIAVLGRQPDALDLMESYRRAYLSAVWAALIEDPCRRGKSWLTCIEVRRALELFAAGRVAAFEDDTLIRHPDFLGESERRALFDGFRLREDPAVAASHAWAMIEKGEIGRVYYWTTSSLYRYGGRAAGPWGRAVRLFALSLLETS
ncbi:MAG: SIR2 family protein [Chloroflexota bacterium]|nr:SIR2 family protein [Chloroflexota bacterium]